MLLICNENPLDKELVLWMHHYYKNKAIFIITDKYLIRENYFPLKIVPHVPESPNPRTSFNDTPSIYGMTGR